MQGRLPSGELQAALVPVDAHDLSRGADAKSELEGDGPVAAADIQTAHPAADADAAKQRFGRRPLGTSQQLQALRRLFSAQENVIFVTRGLIRLH